MRHIIFILLAVALSFLHGQERRGGSPPALDPGDIRNFLNQAQMVEFKPTLRRDPFRLPSGGAANNPVGNDFIDNITIIGRLVFNKKTYAMAVDSMQTVLQLPVGYQFADGVITAITDKEVVFTQWDPNLGNQSIRRTVRKVFNTEDDR
jgi:hypothetical protein